MRRVEPRTASKFVNIIDVTHRDEVEAPITGWLREAYDFQDAPAARRPARKKAGTTAAKKPAKRPAKKPAMKAAKKSAMKAAKKPARKNAARRQ